MPKYFCLGDPSKKVEELPDTGLVHLCRCHSPARILSRLPEEPPNSNQAVNKTPFRDHEDDVPAWAATAD